MESLLFTEGKWAILCCLVLIAANILAIHIIIELFGYDQLVDQFNPEGITKRVHPGKPAWLLFISVLCNLFFTVCMLLSKLMDTGEP